MNIPSLQNQLYYGDCLQVMQTMLLDCVDLIYLDPPFNSNRAYNAIYRDSTGQELPDQVEAFCDIWEMTHERELALRAMPLLMRKSGIDDQTTKFWQSWMNALRNTQPRLLAYLIYMAERLIVMKRLLKPTGSVYLHCDPTASHYIKIMMDSIFGHDNFRNEIVWHYQTGGASKRWFSKKHDILLFYSKTKKYHFYPDNVRVVRTDEVLRRIKSGVKGATRAITETKLPMDVWVDIQALNPMEKERIGYPTQKPVRLLRRIIKASTKESDVVFDPFCGCASTIAAAHELNRKWIGIDIAYHAIRRVVQTRLKDHYQLVEGVHYSVNGVPRTLEGAQDLWKRDKYQFQRWAIERVNGFCTTRRTADSGIDGRLYFHHPKEKELQSMVLEVKGGKNIDILSVVRNLRGVLERDDALMAGLILMESLSPIKERNFKYEMCAAGVLDILGTQYARMQVLSVQDILAGKAFITPSVAGQGNPQAVLPLSN